MSTVEDAGPIAYYNGKRVTIPVEYRKYVAGGSKKGASAKRIALWIEQDGLCHWCSKLTLLPDQPGYYRKNGDHVTALTKDAATLDHMYSRLNPLRKRRSWYVMACHGCNMERAKRECQGEFKSEHERRSRNP